jgi:NAD(P)-dependent dehydrogenase (short-subunit alcohol dehydrogenase family)
VDVAGARILVTAGSRRLGAAIATDLAGWGADVAVTYRTRPEDAEAIVAAIADHGRSGFAVRADLTRRDDVHAAVRAASEALGGLDGVVHCASGGFAPRPLAELTEEDVDEALGATLRGALFVAQAAAEHLADGGAVVFIGDLAALRGWPAFLAHSAAKGGLRPLTSGLARALAPRVRVSLVHPGTVLPEEGTTPEQAARDVEATLLRRAGSSQDVSRAVRYLLEAPFVTGEELVVDGGRRLK